MEQQMEQQRQRDEPLSKRPRKVVNDRELVNADKLFSQCQITKTIMIPITAIGKLLTQTIKSMIEQMVSGKCIVEGYVKPHSVEVVTYSSGKIKGDQVIFDVVFTCFVFHPMPLMRINCVANTITKAGITAISADINPSPFILFISRDHHMNDLDHFKSINEKDTFTAEVIDSRFELNDKQMDIVARLWKPHQSNRF